MALKLGLSPTIWSHADALLSPKLAGGGQVQPRSRFWLGTAIGLTVAQVAASTLLLRGFALTAATDVIEALLLLTLLVALARNAALSRGRLRSFWVLQMTGWAIWFIDQCLWILYYIVLRKPIPPCFSGM